MKFSSDTIGREQEIIDLFTATFTASEGSEEGETVGALAKDLLGSTPAEDLLVFFTTEGSTLLGCIIFSRMNFDQDDRMVFILSPVAVKTDQQGKGIGHSLLRNGLNELRIKGVDFAVTYGDPKYYSKVGFRQMTEEFAQAPFKLTQPNGWLGQSLTDQDMEAFLGPSHCVAALNNPALW